MEGLRHAFVLPRLVRFPLDRRRSTLKNIATAEDPTIVLKSGYIWVAFDEKQKLITNICVIVLTSYTRAPRAPADRRRRTRGLATRVCEGFPSDLLCAPAQGPTGVLGDATDDGTHIPVDTVPPALHLCAGPQKLPRTLAFKRRETISGFEST